MKGSQMAAYISWCLPGTWAASSSVWIVCMNTVCHLRGHRAFHPSRTDNQEAGCDVDNVTRYRSKVRFVVNVFRKRYCSYCQRTYTLKYIFSS